MQCSLDLPEILSGSPSWASCVFEPRNTIASANPGDLMQENRPVGEQLFRQDSRSWLKQREKCCWLSLRGRGFRGFDSSVEAELLYFAGWIKLGSGSLKTASRPLPLRPNRTCLAKPADDLQCTSQSVTRLQTQKLEPWAMPSSTDHPMS